MVYFRSPFWLGHDREFIWSPRGFRSVYEMNETIVKKWNEVVQPKDEVYVLGDLMLGDNEVGMQLIHQLKGTIHVVRGNHDTSPRIDLYKNSYNIIEVTEGQFLKIDGQNFYLCHYPTFTSNLEKSSSLKEHIINLYGHTHQKTNFYQDIPFMYHVGVDSHDCYPVSIDQILMDITKKRDECLKYL